jgi:hypothetical protein
MGRSSWRGCSTTGVREASQLAPFLWFFLFVLVYRNRVQVLSLKYLATIEAADIIDAVSTVQKLSSLVLTSLHSEITPILE